ncbi:unnamed protein product, partial [Prunus brigantina]
MLRIRDHKQKLVDLHNLTTSRGLIGTQALLRCPPAAREGQEEERDNERHHSLTIGSQNRNPHANHRQCRRRCLKACQGRGHDMPTQGKPRHAKLPIASLSSKCLEWGNAKPRPHQGKARHVKAKPCQGQAMPRPPHAKASTCQGQGMTCQRKARPRMPTQGPTRQEQSKANASQGNACQGHAQRKASQRQRKPRQRMPRPCPTQSKPRHAQRKASQGMPNARQAKANASQGNGR